MKEAVAYNLQVLQEKVEITRERIRSNRERLRNILDMPHGELRTELFLECSRKSQELYSRSYGFIKLQSELRRTLIAHQGLKTFGNMSLS